MTRSKREAQWWDRAKTDPSPNGYVHLDPADIRRIDIICSARDGLVLDAGGGHGNWAKLIADHGRSVVCGDISFNSLSDIHCDKVIPCRMDVERIPLADGSVAAIHGQDIIHHVDPANFGSECARVLAPGGVVLMWENSDANPLLIFARRFLCGHFGIPKWSTPDEHPLSARERKAFSSFFDYAGTEYPQFLFFHYLDAKFFAYRNPVILKVCKALDAGIYKYLPLFRSFSYRQLIVCRKKASDNSPSAHSLRT